MTAPATMQSEARGGAALMTAPATMQSEAMRRSGARNSGHRVRM
jgi:hypothetical protein